MRTRRVVVVAVLALVVATAALVVPRPRARRRDRKSRSTSSSTTRAASCPASSCRSRARASARSRTSRSRSDFKARVHMRVDPRFAPFRDDATCTIKPQGLIAENYVDCRPGAPRGDAAARAATARRRPCPSSGRRSPSASPTCSRSGTRRRASASGCSSRRSASRPPGAARTSTRSCAAPTRRSRSRAGRSAQLAAQRDDLARVVDDLGPVAARARRAARTSRAALLRHASRGRDARPPRERAALGEGLRRLPGLLRRGAPALREPRRGDGRRHAAARPSSAPPRPTSTACRRTSRGSPRAARPTLRALAPVLARGAATAKRTVPLTETVRRYARESLPSARIAGEMLPDARGARVRRRPPRLPLQRRARHGALRRAGPPPPRARRAVDVRALRDDAHARCGGADRSARRERARRRRERAGAAATGARAGASSGRAPPPRGDRAPEAAPAPAPPVTARAPSCRRRPSRSRTLPDTPADPTVDGPPRLPARMSARRLASTACSTTRSSSALLILAVAAVVLYISYTRAARACRGRQTNSHVDVPDAGKLIKNAEVRIGGARVGQVLAIEADAAARAACPRTPRSRCSSTATSRRCRPTPAPRCALGSVLGGKYLALDPGRQRGGRSPWTASCRWRNASSTVDIDEAFEIFDPRAARRCGVDRRASPTRSPAAASDSTTTIERDGARCCPPLRARARARSPRRAPTCAGFVARRRGRPPRSRAVAAELAAVRRRRGDDVRRARRGRRRAGREHRRAAARRRRAASARCATLRPVLDDVEAIAARPAARRRGPAARRRRADQRGVRTAIAVDPQVGDARPAARPRAGARSDASPTTRRAPARCGCSAATTSRRSGRRRSSGSARSSRRTWEAERHCRVASTWIAASRDVASDGDEGGNWLRMIPIFDNEQSSPRAKPVAEPPRQPVPARRRAGVRGRQRGLRRAGS